MNKVKINCYCYLFLSDSSDEEAFVQNMMVSQQVQLVWLGLSGKYNNTTAVKKKKHINLIIVSAMCRHYLQFYQLFFHTLYCLAFPGVFLWPHRRATRDIEFDPYPYVQPSVPISQ